jgi:uncharacterized membrane-anchored protein
MKKILFVIFIVVCIIQLAVPAKMAWDKEKVIRAGLEFKFRTAPVDPYDPFRGKYITLAFDANHYEIQTDSTWKPGDEVYVYLGTDEKGFAKIEDLSKIEPGYIENLGLPYVKAIIRYAYDNKVTIDYSFNRFYMDENKAADAETKYREVARDTNQVAYALVSVKNGEAALKDVMINNVSISEIVGRR